MTGRNRTGWMISAVRGGCRRRRVSVLAQGAVITALVLAGVQEARAESFGRWFFTIEERRVLDDRRDAGEAPKPIQRKAGPKAAAPVVDVISFDGKVERSGGGASTVWVNGRPVYTGNTTAEGIRVQPSQGTGGEARFVLPPSETGTTDFSLRAGQKVAVQNGRKFDAYESRPDEESESVLGAGEPETSEQDPDAQTPPGEADVPAAARVLSPGG